MKIGTRLRLNTWISLGAIILMLFALAWSFWEAQRADQNVSLIHEIEKTAYDRVMLKDDWLLNRENRAKTQWLAKTESLRKLLKSASERAISKEAKDLLEDARMDFAATSSIFTKVLEQDKQQERAAKNNLAFAEAESRLISQLFLKAYSLNGNISRLHESYRKAAIEARNKGIIIIIFFIIISVIVTIVNTASLNVTMAKSLKVLADGIKIIGDGNLDHRIETTSDDEISSIALASNEMAYKLKKSYTSLENLQREITERRESEGRYRTLFNESLDGLCLADAETGIIIDCNKALAALVCRERAELIGQPQAILHPPQDDKEAFSVTFSEHLTDKQGQIIETQVVTRTGDIREVAIKANFVVLQGRKMLHGIFHDITERKLTEGRIYRQSELLAAINSIFLEALTAINKEAVAQTCLRVAQALTGSKFGLIGEITPENLFTTTALSNPGWEACRIPETQANVMIKNMVIRGIWGQVILKKQSLIVNDPVSYPDRVGIPEGHPPLTSFLGVPLKDRGKVIGMIAVANSDSGYTADHQQDLEALSVAFAEAIQRQQAEENIRLLNVELEQRVIKRTAELTAKTVELERINKVFVDRELKMMELKKRIAELEKK